MIVFAPSTREASGHFQTSLRKLFDDACVVDLNDDLEVAFQRIKEYVTQTGVRDVFLSACENDNTAWSIITALELRLRFLHLSDSEWRYHNYDRFFQLPGVTILFPGPVGLKWRKGQDVRQLEWAGDEHPESCFKIDIKPNHVILYGGLNFERLIYAIVLRLFVKSFKLGGPSWGIIFDKLLGHAGVFTETDISDFRDAGYVFLSLLGNKGGTRNLKGRTMELLCKGCIQASEWDDFGEMRRLGFRSNITHLSFSGVFDLVRKLTDYSLVYNLNKPSNQKARYDLSKNHSWETRRNLLRKLSSGHWAPAKRLLDHSSLGLPFSHSSRLFVDGCDPNLKLVLVNASSWHVVSVSEHNLYFAMCYAENCNVNVAMGFEVKIGELKFKMRPRFCNSGSSVNWPVVVNKNNTANTTHFFENSMGEMYFKNKVDLFRYIFFCRVDASSCTQAHQQVVARIVNLCGKLRDLFKASISNSSFFSPPNIDGS